MLLAETDLPLTDKATSLMDQYVIPYGLKAGIALAILLIGLAIARGVAGGVQSTLKRRGKDPLLVDFLTSILRSLLYLIVIVAALGQLGVQTSGIVAMVGAAGLAIGLALQDSLKNFAAGVMLISFRPFKTGDVVEAAGITGVVEEIKIFSSMLRTPDNHEITIPNGEIYSGPIINYTAREKRRVDMVFGIGYDDDLRKAKEVLERLLGEDDRVLKDPEPFIAVGELADSSVNLLVRPWVKTGDFFGFKCDYTEKVKLAFDAEGISIPYQTMDVNVTQGS